MPNINKPCQTIFFNYNLVKYFNYYKQNHIVKNYTKPKQTDIKKIKKKNTGLKNKYAQGKTLF